MIKPNGLFMIFKPQDLALLVCTTISLSLCCEPAFSLKRFASSQLMNGNSEWGDSAEEAAALHYNAISFCIPRGLEIEKIDEKDWRWAGGVFQRQHTFECGAFSLAAFEASCPEEMIASPASVEAGFLVGCIEGECGNNLYKSNHGVCLARDEVKCPSPYVLNEEVFLCEAYCNTGHLWSEAKQSCITPPQEQSCKEQTANPIDLTQGRKFRAESVLSTGTRYSFALNYSYNNQANQEKAANGVQGVISTNRYLAATMPPMTATEYRNNYTHWGLSKNDPAVLPTQHYGAQTQYWRHNFDEVLQIQNGAFTYHPPKGNSITFSSVGKNAIYPHLDLQALNTGEEPFAGYKITNYKTNTIKKFNADGRLVKIEAANTDVLVLTYTAEGDLQKVTNSEGAYLEFAYESKNTNSIYSTEASTHNYPTQITSNTGQKVQLQWGQAYEGQTATFHMLTQISHPYTGATPTSAKSFEYNDARYPASVSDIHTIQNLATGTKTQYAQFTYDNSGRAIQSGLSNGLEGVTVTYPSDTQTIVTNALGKNSTYNYATFNGVKRLQSVVGQATSNCAQSNTVYSYYANGNLKTTTQNGVVTHYQYNANNQKTVTTQAQGEVKETITQTCWHPTHNKPERVIEPSRVVVYEYFDNGQLKSKKVEARSAQNSMCVGS